MGRIYEYAGKAGWIGVSGSSSAKFAVMHNGPHDVVGYGRRRSGSAW
jgi:hypothetical protein